ncbi:MAG: winged helix-turn-helix transcriptional regulator [Candidatus Thorarchaeota archaeon]|nr:winged helix-turn-helix transcriptional regulator [Candidatus Thorarchaeota archaeon]
MTIIPEDPPLQQRLSPSAYALLQTVQRLEDGQEVVPFQGVMELQQIQKMVSTYRGSLHTGLLARLRILFERSNDVIVTQRELFTLIAEVWLKNISRLSSSEVEVMKAIVETPSVQISDLSKAIGLSYAQVRRAISHLSEAGIIRIGGILNHQAIGLARFLIILENPTLILSSPYVEKVLFADGPTSLVFLIVSCPRDHIDELSALVRSLRSTSDNATIWRLSSGRLHFSNIYYNRQAGAWDIDQVHFRLQLRHERDSVATSRFYEDAVKPVHITKSDALLVDALRKNYNASAIDMVEKTGLSESTVFKRRVALTRDSALVLPRARITIPSLSERLLLLLSTDAVPAISHAWSHLPLSYRSRIFNVENGPQTRAIMLAALPPGTGWQLSKIILEETSAIDQLSVHVLSAASDQQLSVASMFNTRTASWRWNQGDFLDVRGYAIVRREANPTTIPIDLAT